MQRRLSQSASLRHVSLAEIAAATGTVADVSAVDVTVGGWMRFASGLLRAEIAAMAAVYGIEVLAARVP